MRRPAHRENHASVKVAISLIRETDPIAEKVFDMPFRIPRVGECASPNSVTREDELAGQKEDGRAVSTKTVVELDLVGYSDVSRLLEENLDIEVVARFNEQIQEFVDVGLRSIEAQRGHFVMATTGDGAILAFDYPADAHRFGASVHQATQAHNAKRSLASAQRWFRIGLATGELYQRPRPGGGQEIAGTVIGNAVRLERAARPGQLVADSATFTSLAGELQALYGPEETVLGKRDERFAARRCTIVEYSTAENLPPTIQSILDLFDRLNPRDQLSRLMLIIGMPDQYRPPDTLELFRRQDKIVDWAAGRGDDGLVKLDAALKSLIRKQQPTRQ
jgi:class 3 adenylate cyclase